MGDFQRNTWGELTKEAESADANRIISSGRRVNRLSLIKLSGLLSGRTGTRAGMCLFVAFFFFFLLQTRRRTQPSRGAPQPRTPAQTRLGTIADCGGEGG